MRHNVPGLVDILRKTLEDMQDSGLEDSGAVRELKRHILRTIAQLHAEQQDEAEAPPRDERLIA